MYQDRLSNRRKPKNSENNADVAPTSRGEANKYEGVTANDNGSDQGSEYEYDIITDDKPDTSNANSRRQVPQPTFVERADGGIQKSSDIYINVKDY